MVGYGGSQQADMPVPRRARPNRATFSEPHRGIRNKNLEIRIAFSLET